MRKNMLFVAGLVSAAVLLSSMAFGQAKKPAAKPAAKPKPAAAKPAAAKPLTPSQLMAKYKAAPASTVVATVNGESITKQQLLDILWDWNAPSALEEMIQQRLIQQEAKKQKVSLSQADVDARMEEMKKRLPPGQALDEALQRYGITMSSFMARNKSQLLAEKVVEKDIKPTDADYAGFVSASHILVRVQPGKDEEERKKNEAAAKEKIDKIAAEIKGGKDFAAAAKEYSDDTSNKDKGGDLGWFERGRMAPDFEEAAFTQKPGEVGAPVKTLYGYHLIKVAKLGKDASPTEKAELRDQIVQKQKGQMLGPWYQKLRDKAKIDNKIAPKPKEEPKPAMAPAPKPAPKTAPAPAPKPAPAPAQ